MGRVIVLSAGVVLLTVLFSACLGGEEPSLELRLDEALPFGWQLVYFKDHASIPYGWQGRSACAYARVENTEHLYHEFWFCPAGWSASKDDLIPWPISAEKFFSTVDYDVYAYSPREGTGVPEAVRGAFVE